MDAQLERGWQTVLFNRKGDYSEVFAEFLFELADVANVIDALIEPAGEFWGNGLDRYGFISDCSEDEQQFGRSLGLVRLVDRHLGNERATAPLVGNMAVNLACFLGSQQIFAREFFDICQRGPESMVNARNVDLPDQLRVAADKARNRLRRR